MYFSDLCACACAQPPAKTAPAGAKNVIFMPIVRPLHPVQHALFNPEIVMPCHNDSLGPLLIGILASAHHGWPP